MFWDAIVSITKKIYILFAPLDDITTKDGTVMIRKVEIELIMVEILRGGVFLVVPEVSSQ